MDFETLNLRDRYSRELLTQFYADLITPNFGRFKVCYVCMPQRYLRLNHVALWAYALDTGRSRQFAGMDWLV